MQPKKKKKEREKKRIGGLHSVDIKADDLRAKEGKWRREGE